MTPPYGKAIELSAFITWMEEDGICRTVTRPGAAVNIDSAIENTLAVAGFYKNKKFPLLIDSRDIKSMTREARKHFSTNGRDTVVNSMAIVVGSPLSRVIGNFFMGLNKPGVPARLFTNENEAILWLKQYL